MQALCSSPGPLGPPCDTACHRLREGAPGLELRHGRQQLGCVSCLAGRSPPALPKRRHGSSSRRSAPVSRSFQPIRLGADSGRHTFSARRASPPGDSTGLNATEEGHLRRRHAVPDPRTHSVTQTCALQRPASASRQLSGLRISRGAVFRETRPIGLHKRGRTLGSPVAFSRGPGNGSSNDPLGVFSFLNYAFSAGKSNGSSRGRGRSPLDGENDQAFAGTLLQPAVQSLYQLWLFLTQTLDRLLQNALPWETPTPVVSFMVRGGALLFLIAVLRGFVEVSVRIGLVLLVLVLIIRLGETVITSVSGGATKGAPPPPRPFGAGSSSGDGYPYPPYSDTFPQYGEEASNEFGFGSRANGASRGGQRSSSQPPQRGERVNGTPRGGMRSDPFSSSTWEELFNPYSSQAYPPPSPDLPEERPWQASGPTGPSTSRRTPYPPSPPGQPGRSPPRDGGAPRGYAQGGSSRPARSRPGRPRRDPTSLGGWDTGGVPNEGDANGDYGAYGSWDPETPDAYSGYTRGAQGESPPSSYRVEQRGSAYSPSPGDEEEGGLGRGGGRAPSRREQGNRWEGGQRGEGRGREVMREGEERGGAMRGKGSISNAAVGGQKGQRGQGGQGLVTWDAFVGSGAQGAPGAGPGYRAQSGAGDLGAEQEYDGMSDAGVSADDSDLEPGEDEGAGSPGAFQEPSLASLKWILGMEPDAPSGKGDSMYSDRRYNDSGNADGQGQVGGYSDSRRTWASARGNSDPVGQVGSSLGPGSTNGAASMRAASATGFTAEEQGQDVGGERFPQNGQWRMVQGQVVQGQVVQGQMVQGQVVQGQVVQGQVVQGQVGSRRAGQGQRPRRRRRSDDILHWEMADGRGALSRTLEASQAAGPAAGPTGVSSWETLGVPEPGVSALGSPGSRPVVSLDAVEGEAPNGYRGNAVSAREAPGEAGIPTYVPSSQEFRAGSYVPGFVGAEPNGPGARSPVEVTGMETSGRTGRGAGAGGQLAVASLDSRSAEAVAVLRALVAARLVAEAMQQTGALPPSPSSAGFSNASTGLNQAGTGFRPAGEGFTQAGPGSTGGLSGSLPGAQRPVIEATFVIPPPGLEPAPESQLAGGQPNGYDLQGADGFDPAERVDWVERPAVLPQVMPAGPATGAVSSAAAAPAAPPIAPPPAPFVAPPVAPLAAVPHVEATLGAPALPPSPGIAGDAFTFVASQEAEMEGQMDFLLGEEEEPRGLLQGVGVRQNEGTSPTPASDTRGTLEAAMEGQLDFLLQGGARQEAPGAEESLSDSREGLEAPGGSVPRPAEGAPQAAPAAGAGAPRFGVDGALFVLGEGGSAARIMGSASEPEPAAVQGAVERRGEESTSLQGPWQGRASAGTESAWGRPRRVREGSSSGTISMGGRRRVVRESDRDALPVGNQGQLAGDPAVASRESTGSESPGSDTEGRATGSRGAGGAGDRAGEVAEAICRAPTPQGRRPQPAPGYWVAAENDSSTGTISAGGRPRAVNNSSLTNPNDRARLVRDTSDSAGGRPRTVNDSTLGGSPSERAWVGRDTSDSAGGRPRVARNEPGNASAEAQMQPGAEKVVAPIGQREILQRRSAAFEGSGADSPGTVGLGGRTRVVQGPSDSARPPLGPTQQAPEGVELPGTENSARGQSLQAVEKGAQVQGAGNSEAWVGEQGATWKRDPALPGSGRGGEEGAEREDERDEEDGAEGEEGGSEENAGTEEGEEDQVRAGPAWERQTVPAGSGPHPWAAPPQDWLFSALPRSRGGDPTGNEAKDSVAQTPLRGPVARRRGSDSMSPSAVGVPGAPGPSAPGPVPPPRSSAPAPPQAATGQAPIRASPAAAPPQAAAVRAPPRASRPSPSSQVAAAPAPPSAPPPAATPKAPAAAIGSSTGSMPAPAGGTPAVTECNLPAVPEREMPAGNEQEVRVGGRAPVPAATTSGPSAGQRSAEIPKSAPFETSSTRVPGAETPPSGEGPLGARGVRQREEASIFSGATSTRQSGDEASFISGTGRGRQGGDEASFISGTGRGRQGGEEAPISPSDPDEFARGEPENIRGRDSEGSRGGRPVGPSSSDSPWDSTGGSPRERVPKIPLAVASENFESAQVRRRRKAMRSAQTQQPPLQPQRGQQLQQTQQMRQMQQMQQLDQAQQLEQQRLRQQQMEQQQLLQQRQKQQQWQQAQQAQGSERGSRDLENEESGEVQGAKKEFDPVERGLWKFLARIGNKIYSQGYEGSTEWDYDSRRNKS